MSADAEHAERLADLENWREHIERRFADAFPGADHIGHCRYHELMIQQIEERRTLRMAIQEKTLSGLVWAAIVGLAFAAWSYLKSTLGKG